MAAKSNNMKKKNNKGVGNPLTVAKVASTAKKVSSNVKTQAKENPSVVKIVALSAMGLLGIKLASNAFKNKNESSSSDSFTEGTQTEKLPSGQTLTYNPSQIASEYDNAMGTGWTGAIDGTSVNPIMILATKSRGSRWKHISQAYKKQTGKVLLTTLKDELHALEYKAFVAILNEKYASKYKYSIGEMLNLTSVTDVLVYNTKTKKTYKDSFRWNGSFIGQVVKRVPGPKKGAVWYTLSKYPDLQIHQNYLKRAYDSYAQQIWLRTGV